MDDSEKAYGLVVMPVQSIKAIDDLMHFVDHHFTKADPVMWEHLDLLGGAVALHDIVRRGLRDREERLARRQLN